MSISRLKSVSWNLRVLTAAAALVPIAVVIGFIAAERHSIQDEIAKKTESISRNSLGNVTRTIHALCEVEQKSLEDRVHVGAADGAVRPGPGGRFWPRAGRGGVGSGEPVLRGIDPGPVAAGQGRRHLVSPDP